MYNLNKKRILVTGGAGFVGSNLVKTLLNNFDCEVTVLDDLFTGDLNNLNNLKINFIEGSVEDFQLVTNVISKQDVVFHLAARNIIVSNKNPREDLQTNVIGSFNVFEACRVNNIERVVYSSTSSIYGNPESMPISEEDKKSFLSFYSSSKFSAEVYAMTYFQVYDLPISIVRYSNVYGYNQLPTNPYCGVIGKFFISAMRGEKIRIHGDGEQTRDYTFINDAIDATISAAIYERAIGNAYNVGTGIEVSVNRLAEIIIKQTKSSSCIEYIDKRDIDNIRRRVINIEKSRLDLKYHPQINLTKGIQMTHSWMKNVYNDEQ
jgi:UDP-glucose 4-epimerase